MRPDDAVLAKSVPVLVDGRLVFCKAGDPLPAGVSAAEFRRLEGVPALMRADLWRNARYARRARGGAPRAFRRRQAA